MPQNPYYNNIRYSKPPARPARQESDFNELEATELYCGNCRQAVPVRKRLLLVLPEGDKYEYQCQYCGAKVGDKIDKTARLKGLF
ncbi:MAG: cytoplasmic protein [Deltaproteobacteria bacterium]|nr:cytoplasmic protein [Deltaproteobacteria bacterium]